MIGGAEAR
ncbi:unnamed protein product, partial [Rotaria sp. Silwood1]